MGQYDISLADGKAYTLAWRTAHSSLVKGFKIDKACIDDIFTDNPTAVSMRAYIGLDGSAPKLVMVGVDAAGNDLTANVYDHASPCPSVCDISSPLNS